MTQFGVPMPAHGRQHAPGGSDPIEGPRIVTVTPFTANVNNWSPPDFSSGFIWQLTASGAARDITGIRRPPNAYTMWLHNAGTNAIILRKESTSSDVENRFYITNDFVLGTNMVTMVQYDNVAHAWRMPFGQFQSGLALTVSDTALNANQNDYNPTNLSTALFLRLGSTVSTAPLVTISSIVAQSAGRLLHIHNVGSNPIVFLDDDGATGTAANRLALTGNIVLLPDATLVLQYDHISARWRAVGGSGYIQDSHGCSVYQAAGAGQSINPGAGVALTWDSETKDADGFHSTSSQTSRITIPPGFGGWYAVNASVQWVGEAFTGTVLSLQITVNGAVVAGNRTSQNPLAAAFAASGNELSTSTMVYLTEGQYLEAVVLHDDADAIVVNTSGEGGMSAVLVSK